jgi:hypothetical protein
MLVVRGETLYDLETSPAAQDGVAPIAGAPEREDEPVRGEPEPPPADGG